MSTDYADRSNDEEIIDIVRSVMDNGTGTAETVNEHILIKLMQLRGTPINSFEFDQDRVDFHFLQWKKGPDLGSWRHNDRQTGETTKPQKVNQS